MRMTRVVGRKAAGHERRLVAGSSHRESPRKSRLCDTLLTLVAPASLKTASAKARIFASEHELSTATVACSSQATKPGAMDKSAQVACGNVQGKLVAEADRKLWPA